jgi:hypothetical protein
VDSGNPRRISAITARFPAEIRTEHQANLLHEDEITILKLKEPIMEENFGFGNRIQFLDLGVKTAAIKSWMFSDHGRTTQGCNSEDGAL